MNQLVIPAESSQIDGLQYHVSVFVQADVLNPELVRHKANLWLGMNVGNLLAAENPELLLGEILRWRFDVFLTQPILAVPGTATRRRVAQIQLDVTTGEVLNGDAFEAELRENVAALAVA